MSKLFLEGEEIDSNILKRNPSILKSELERILEKRKEELILIQSVEQDESFTLALGKYTNIHTDSRGDYVHLDEPLVLKLDVFDEKQLEHHVDKNKFWLDIAHWEDSIYFFMYKGNPQEIAKIIDCRKKVVYKNEEEIKLWYDNNREWKKTLGHDIRDGNWYASKLVESYLQAFGSIKPLHQDG